MGPFSQSPLAPAVHLKRWLPEAQEQWKLGLWSRHVENKERKQDETVNVKD